ncbi:MAG: hypothetical protein N4P89_00835 [Candidatus Lightella neohaematopini]|nr:hypothetical protein [Candidatus Lightella neohaematopini]MCV2528694.1 hypothetical protein [Candidatus Lightella neohaematopini]
MAYENNINNYIWYPWLNEQYKEIINFYNKKKFNAIIIYNQVDNSNNLLCYAISRKLICQSNNYYKSCNICSNCILMANNNYPYYYKLHYSTLNIQKIRDIITDVNKFSFKYIKIIYIINIEKLTYSIISALLKIIEYPPSMTYFILSCNNISIIPLTIKSRCICWNMKIPNENYSIKWLQNIIHDKEIIIRTSLRICNGSPINALLLLKSNLWNNRHVLINTLNNALLKNNMVLLLPILNTNNKLIYLLITLISDTIKLLKNTNKLFLINLDIIDVIKKSLHKNNIYKMYKLWNNLINCWYFLNQKNNINRELLILHCLINW